MAKATREQSQATAEHVLDVASHLFAERGFAAVGLDEIARQAGVTRGAIYHHYGSKVGVFRAVHDKLQAQVAVAIDDVTEGEEDTWRALELGCHEFLIYSVRPEVQRILLVDAPAVLGWEVWRAADSANSGQRLAGVLADLKSAGVIDFHSLGAIHSLLTGAMNEAALWAAEGPDSRARIKEVWSELARLLGAMKAGH